MKTTKLITEYKAKVAECEKVIAGISTSIGKARFQKEHEDVILDLANERRVEDAKRQSYVQFIKDLEDL